ncbi:MAG: hypothetical protein ACTSPW_18855 [Promethearchaeota archaeon]
MNKKLRLFTLFLLIILIIIECSLLFSPVNAQIITKVSKQEDKSITITDSIPFFTYEMYTCRKFGDNSFSHSFLLHSSGYNMPYEHTIIKIYDINGNEIKNKPISDNFIVKRDKIENAFEIGDEYGIHIIDKDKNHYFEINFVKEGNIPVQYNPFFIILEVPINSTFPFIRLQDNYGHVYVDITKKGNYLQFRDRYGWNYATQDTIGNYTDSDNSSQYLVNIKVCIDKNNKQFGIVFENSSDCWNWFPARDTIDTTGIMNYFKATIITNGTGNYDFKIFGLFYKYGDSSYYNNLAYKKDNRELETKTIGTRKMDRTLKLDITYENRANVPNIINWSIITLEFRFTNNLEYKQLFKIKVESKEYVIPEVYYYIPYENQTNMYIRIYTFSYNSEDTSLSIVAIIWYDVYYYQQITLNHILSWLMEGVGLLLIILLPSIMLSIYVPEFKERKNTVFYLFILIMLVVCYIFDLIKIFNLIVSTIIVVILLIIQLERGNL